jgi:hypothetical protein
MYTLLNSIVQKLNDFIDAPLILKIGRDSIINHDNDLGNTKAGATYIALIQPSNININVSDIGFAKNTFTARLFFGQLYKRNETQTSTNEFNDSGANEVKILEQTLALCNEFVYKLNKHDSVKTVSNARVSEAFDVKDTNHTGHYLDLTFELREPLCFSQAVPTPPPPPPPPPDMH